MISLRSTSIHDFQLLKLCEQQPHVIDSDPIDDLEWEAELKRSSVCRKKENLILMIVLFIS